MRFNEGSDSGLRPWGLRAWTLRPQGCDGLWVVLPGLSQLYVDQLQC